jgi:hypothetical protein
MTDDLASILANAKREIGSFYQAVLLTYGAAEARAAAKDWLDIMESLETLPNKTGRYWRRVTILAADRLATRVCSLRSA